MLKIGFRKYEFADKPRWEGVLRDERGEVVWCCGHKHDCRDSNNSRMFRHQGAARKCASAELVRRSN
jgi:hypothetical protein